MVRLALRNLVAFALKAVGALILVFGALFMLGGLLFVLGLIGNWYENRERATWIRECGLSRSLPACTEARERIDRISAGDQKEWTLECAKRRPVGECETEWLVAKAKGL